MDTLETLSAAATRALSRAASADSSERTHHLHEAATALVGIRALTLDADGAPDWRGRTLAYRRRTSDIFRAAGVSTDARTKSTLRYHINNALRQRLGKRQLEALGLLPVSQRERASESYHRLASDALLGRSLDPSSPEALDAILKLLRAALRATPPGPVTRAQCRAARNASHALDKWADKHRPL